jgi:predicted PurR-regulated permease PerM
MNQIPVQTHPIIRRSIATLAIIAIAFVALALCFVDVIPKSALTGTAIDETSNRIEMYFHQNRQLPLQLTDLPTRKGYMNRITDAWDRPLQYTINTPTTFTLSSLGRDNTPGGAQNDADLSRKFQILKGQLESIP